MPTPFPHKYETTLRWQADRCGMIRGGPKPALIGGPPPQFDGQERWWSPEELLVSAANLCLMTTFLTLASRRGIEIAEYTSKGSGTLDKVEGQVRFTRLTLEVRLRVGAGQLELAAAAFETAKKHCIVANSLTAPVEAELDLAEQSHSSALIGT